MCARWVVRGAPKRIWMVRRRGMVMGVRMRERRIGCVWEEELVSFMGRSGLRMGYWHNRTHKNLDCNPRENITTTATTRRTSPIFPLLPSLPPSPFHPTITSTPILSPTPILSSTPGNRQTARNINHLHHYQGHQRSQERTNWIPHQRRKLEVVSREQEDGM